MPKDYLRSRKYRMDAWPLCLRCMRPHDPLLHYCPNCQAVVGQYTPNIPFVNIAYQAEFWGGLWRHIWSPEEGRIATRAFGIVMIVLCAPILLVGLPFMLLAGRRGSKKVAVLWTEGPPPPVPPPPTSPPPLPSAPDIMDGRPRFEDRPDKRPGD